MFKLFKRNSTPVTTPIAEPTEEIYSGPMEVYLETGEEFQAHTPSDIRHVIFTDTPLPRYCEKIDVSRDKDRSIIAYLEDKEINGQFERDTMIVTSMHKGVKIMANPDCSQMFYVRDRIESIAFDNFHTDNVLSMQMMFNVCTRLTFLDLRGFNMRRVENASRMFHSCKGLRSVNTEGWNTENLRDCSDMFIGCSNMFELDISHWNSSDVVNCEYMFFQCHNLKQLNIGDFCCKDTIDTNLSSFVGHKKMFRETENLETLYIGKKSYLEYMNYAIAKQKPDDDILFSEPTAPPLLRNQKVYSAATLAKQFMDNTDGACPNRCVKSAAIWRPLPVKKVSTPKVEIDIG